MKFAPVCALFLFAACHSMPTTDPAPIRTREFGTSADGQRATAWTMRRGDLEITVTDHGATLVAVVVPDRVGQRDDVILGFDSADGYRSADNQYFGCTTGRVCNRIAKGVFTLDGERYVLAVNNGPNHLHGGAVRSFDKVLWQADVRMQGDTPTASFTYVSPDGEEGYPGTLRTVVTYSLPSEHELRIDYAATTDQATPINVTNHAYWNLSGQGQPSILDHVLQIAAERYTPTDDTLIPTGTLAQVQGTPLDFRQPFPIGVRIGQLVDTPAAGYDHNFALREVGPTEDGGLRRAAELYDPKSGRVLEILTTEPGIQFYTGNFLHGQRGKDGAAYAQRSALCLETQHWPDSVNQPSFPSTILRPGETFRSSTVHRFSTR